MDMPARIPPVRDLQCAEVAAVLAGYVRELGFDAAGISRAKHNSTSQLWRCGPGSRESANCSSSSRLTCAVGFVLRHRELRLRGWNPIFPWRRIGPLEPDDAAVKMGVGGTLPAWRYETEE